MKRKVTALILALAMFATIILPAKKISAAPNYDFKVDLDLGFCSSVEVNNHIAINLDITNNGSNFEGNAQIIVPGLENVLYEQAISIQSGGNKKVQMVCMIANVINKVNVRFTDKKGKVLWSELKRIPVSTDKTKVNIGILSDDYPAFSFLEGRKLKCCPEVSTKIFELSQDNFPEDPGALDMLDVIVISNFSTDLLTDAQISAMENWVNKGGLLIVGTGSSSSKTLAKLNNHIVTAKIEKLENFATEFGSDSIIKDYGYDKSSATYYYSYTSNGNNLDPYSDEQYATDFEAIFNDSDSRDEIDNMYKKQFLEEYWISEEDWDEELEKWYYEYAFERYYEIYSESSTVETIEEEVTVHDKVPGDILKMEVEGYSEVISAKKSEGGTLPVSYIIPKGEGYVILSGIDFTMNPFPTYGASGDIFLDYIERLMGQEIIDAHYEGNSYYDYYDNDSYAKRDMFSLLGSETVPPVFLFVLIGILYMVSVIVLYCVFSKKKKTFSLWKIYPIEAAAVALLVMVLGLPTNHMTAKGNVVSISEINNGMFSETDYLSMVVPKMKDYKIGINKDFLLETYKDRRYSYYDETTVDYDQYDYGIVSGAESNTLIIRNDSALVSTDIIAQAAFSTDMSLDIKQASAIYDPQDLYVTNNLDCDLHDCILVERTSTYTSNVYHIGEIRKGKTIKTIYAAENNKKYVYSDDERYVLNSLGDGKKEACSALLLGALCEDYTEFRNKKAALSYLANSSYIEDLDGDKIILIGFVDENVTKEFQKDSDINIKRSCLVYQIFDKNDL